MHSVAGGQANADAPAFVAIPGRQLLCVWEAPGSTLTISQVLLS